MMIIAGVFDNEADLDDVLKSIYEHDIDSSDVTLMRGSDHPGDPAGVYPVIPAAQSSGTTASEANRPLIAVPSGLISDLSIPVETREFYEDTANRGATVLFVEVDDDLAPAITDSMKRGNASRVNNL
jgi:hypothetical protein